MKTACPLCGGADLVSSVSRPRVPVFQNALYASREAARSVAHGDLVLRACRRCGFVFNAAFDPDLVAYGADYENDQTVSAAFAAHMDIVADRVLASVVRRPFPVVLEVGCGQGAFIHRLAARADRPLGGAIGFDPAWRGARHEGQVEIRAELFDAAAATSMLRPIDVVVTRHVIEHVADPIGFLRAISAALPPGQSVQLFIETPCVDWIFDGAVLQDVFYEHCNYFTRSTLAFALARAGFGDATIDHVFGGQYLLARAMAGGVGSVTPPDEASAAAERSVEFARQAAAGIAAWRERLAGAIGGVALWGAGAKGVTFAGAVDPAGSLIDCLIDVNPRKQGNFAASTGHPIVGPEAAVARGVRTVVVMNPNYRPEIAAAAARAGWPFDLQEG